MKTGDLVKMKHEMWWKIRNSNPSLNRSRHYSDECGIVYDIAGKGVKVLMPDNTIKLGLVEHWEVLSSYESR